MIPDYKLYHGAVLAQLVDRMTRPVSIGEFVEEGRLRSYVLDGRVGLLIKHSLQRLTPWQFTFTRENIRELEELRKTYTDSFVVLVCKQDGMVCLTVDEVWSLCPNRADQAAIRVSRHRRELYAVSSGTAELPNRRADGVQMIMEKLGMADATLEKPYQSDIDLLEKDNTVSVRMRWASVLSRLIPGMGK